MHNKSGFREAKWKWRFAKMRRVMLALAALAASALACLVTLSHVRQARLRAVVLKEDKVTEPGFIRLDKDNVGWGPVYYSSTQQYGAKVGKDFSRQPYPVYENIVTEADSNGKVDIDPKQLKMPKDYMKNYRKEWNSYFPKGDVQRNKPPPNPIEAGYWPYSTADGYLATGNPGERGKALRDYLKWDSVRDDDKPAKKGTKKSQFDKYKEDRDKYLGDEEYYKNDMRFYTEDDWP